jgi:hypothetical protein
MQRRRPSARPRILESCQSDLEAAILLPEIVLLSARKAGFLCRDHLKPESPVASRVRSGACSVAELCPRAVGIVFEDLELQFVLKGE